MTAKRVSARKLAFAGGVACFAFVGIQGFTASLGMGTSSFGATSHIVASCGNGLTFAYTTTFDAGISGYLVDRINVTNIPASCLGKSLTATFYSDDGSASGSTISTTLPVSGTSESVPVDPDTNTIDARRVGGVSVVVA